MCLTECVACICSVCVTRCCLYVVCVSHRLLSVLYVCLMDSVSHGQFCAYACFIYCFVCICSVSQGLCSVCVCHGLHCVYVCLTDCVVLTATGSADKGNLYPGGRLSGCGGKGGNCMVALCCFTVGSCMLWL